MKILYLHGFRSSGQTATAKRLQRHLPHDEVIAPDIALDPVVAMTQLKQIAATLGPDDLVVGTSMGGMYALLFKGWKRILINPSLHPSRHMKNFLNQTIEYFTPRKDKIQSFKVTDKLCKKYETFESKIFDSKFGILSKKTDSDENVKAFFATHDTIVNDKEEYLKHFSKYEDFEGEHRLDPDTILNIIIPEAKRMLGKTEEK